MIQGQPLIDGLTLAEIHITMLSALRVSVKAAFINSVKGTTHGWTQAGDDHGGPAWSPRIEELVKELAKALEEDLAKLHFEQVVTETQALGLGEHVAGAGLEAPPA